MAIKKSDLYSSIWASCDELRGGMDASQYKDYVLFMLFIKYVSDKYAEFDGFDPPIVIPKGASFNDMVALTGDPDIGNKINTQIIQPLIDANTRLARADFPDFNATNTSGPSNTASATTWPAVAASLSTTTWKWIKRGTNAPNIDPPVVCTGSGGSGSGYTYAWQWVSGDTQTSAVSPTSSSTKWTRTVPTDQNATYTSTWRCQVTDSGGNTGQSPTVTVTFTMNTLQ